MGGQRTPANWVTKPKERRLAGVGPKQYDDLKLLSFLRKASGELAGLRIVHFHFSCLKDKDDSAAEILKKILPEVAANAQLFLTFMISNGDVMFIYKGISLNSVKNVCEKIGSLILGRTKLERKNIYNEDSIYTIMELQFSFINVIAFIESISTEVEGAAASDKPPITLEEMSKIERSMQIFDLSPMIRNQAIMDVSKRGENHAEYYELYISIKSLADRLSPDFDLTANRWLFNHFTQNLDMSMLKALNQDLSFMQGHRIGINLNLTTIMSSAFEKFDNRLPSAFRGNVILEISKIDFLENMGIYREVAEMAQEREFKITIDGLTPYLATKLDFEDMMCAHAKIFWTPELLELQGDQLRAFKDMLSSQNNCRFILARCDSVVGLVFARRHGIDLVQGRAVDDIVRKGVYIHDAIQAASLNVGYS